jgi:hypothetical protein
MLEPVAWNEQMFWRNLVGAITAMQITPRGRAVGRDLLVRIKSAVTQVDFE